ncbi:hypothetical protein AgCh_027503 [Apium graveolens]
MASSSNPRNASSFNSNGSSSESDDPMMNEIEDYTDYQHIEKSLTNLNANLASVSEQLEGLSISHQEFSFTLKEQQKLFIEGFNQNHEEFCLNFIQQQKLLMEEMVKIRVEATKIRKHIN